MRVVRGLGLFVFVYVHRRSGAQWVRASANRRREDLLTAVTLTAALFGQTVAKNVTNAGHALRRRL